MKKIHMKSLLVICVLLSLLFIITSCGTVKEKIDERKEAKEKTKQEEIERKKKAKAEKKAKEEEKAKKKAEKEKKQKEYAQSIVIDDYSPLESFYIRLSHDYDDDYIQKEAKKCGFSIGGGDGYLGHCDIVIHDYNDESSDDFIGIEYDDLYGDIEEIYFNDGSANRCIEYHKILDGPWKYLILSGENGGSAIDPSVQYDTAQEAFENIYTLE